MIEVGITNIQSKPSIFKNMEFAKIIDKRKKKTLGYYIPSKYENLVKNLIEEIEEKEKIEKLKRLKDIQKDEYIDDGIDDGIE